MSLASPLLIVCFEPHEAVPLRELALALGYPDAQIVPADQVAAALHARPAPPQYLIIDTGRRAGDVLADIDALAQHCEPGIRVAVVGEVNDLTFYRALKARGVLEVSAWPARAADMRAVLLQSAPPPVRTQEPGIRGSVISCMSAASGDGASTLAINLAWCLAEEYKQSTVLVDMDYQYGLVAKSLDLAAPFGIRELFDHPDRGLDNMLVEQMLVKYRDKLNIIAAPGELRQLPPVRPELIFELISVLRAKFRFVVLDIPHVWTDWSAAALRYSDQTVMVAQLWLRSLTHTARLLAACQEAGIDRSAIALVINRSGAKFKEAVTAEDFERICRHRIDAFMDNDIKSVVHAESNGCTLLETRQGAALQQQIRQITKALMARCQGNGGPGEPFSAGGKKGLLGLFDKKAGG